MDDARWVGQGLFRQEASWVPAAWLTFSGAFDARAASDDRVERSWAIDWTDRGLQRPALSVRAAHGSVTRAGFTMVAGKQFVRWGKADVLNPTVRSAPRDLLEVVDNDFLAVTAVRATYERGPDTIDLVWVPLFTPSRVPLAGSRWSFPGAIAGTEAGATPRAAQAMEAGAGLGAGGRPARVPVGGFRFGLPVATAGGTAMEPPRDRLRVLALTSTGRTTCPASASCRTRRPGEPSSPASTRRCEWRAAMPPGH